MAKKQSKPSVAYTGEQQENGAQFSAFQGHLLEYNGSLAAASTDNLREAGITDAEQLIAIAAIPEVMPYLAEKLGISERELATMVQATGSLLPPQIRSSVENPTPAHFSLGALVPTVEMKTAELAAAIAAPEAVSLPAAVNLIARIRPFAIKLSVAPA